MSYLKIVPLALCVLLVGCGTNSTKLSKYNPKLGEASAMIIVKLDNADSLHITRVANINEPSSNEDHEFIINRHTNLPILFKYTDSLYAIEPGTYYISYAYVTCPNKDNFRHKSTKCPGLNAQKQPVYGAFTVASNQVLYLGDVKVDWLNKNPAQLFCMFNNISVVKAEFRQAGYKELSEKMQFADWSH